MTAFVYVIHEVDDDTRVKIGWATDPAGRLCHLQIGNPRKLVIAATRECPSEEVARGVERALHKYLAASSIIGEWFQCRAPMAVKLVDAAQPAARSLREPREIREHEILAAIEEFLAFSGMGQAAFGRAATNDTSLIPQLQAGRELRRATRLKILGYIATHGADAHPNGGAPA